MFNPLWVHSDFTRVVEPVFEEFVRQLHATPPTRRRRTAPAFERTESGWRTQWLVPGARLEDVDVSVEDRVLCIKVSTPDVEETGMHRHRSERNAGERSVRLRTPREADLSTFKATLTRGILEISVDANAAVQPQKITVTE